MSPELDKLVRGFRAAQTKAVDTLTAKLQIPKPESNRAWALYCSAKRLHNLRGLDGLDGIEFRAHGFGIELSIDGSTIDFDWGDEGEPDGFDAWRLELFAENNCPDMRYSYKQLQGWLNEAFQAGELLKDTHLYYDPRFRAPTHGE